MGQVRLHRKENDQYLIKLDGTGKLTLRNHRFLRKYTLPTFSPMQPNLGTIPTGKGMIPSLVNDCSKSRTDIQSEIEPPVCPLVHQPSVHQTRTHPLTLRWRFNVSLIMWRNQRNYLLLKPTSHLCLLSPWEHLLRVDRQL